MSVFFTFWGVLVLLPVYSNAGGQQTQWNKYTLANVPFNPSAKQLWVPAIFAYIFSIYFCHLMYSEYSNFVEKRIEYLGKGDLDTPPQTYYTVRVEKVPSSLRSAPALRNYFENIFPNDVYSVEIALDLTELDKMTTERRKIRNELEKSIAIMKALNKRPLKWVKKDYYSDSESLPQMFDNLLAAWFGYIVIDKIEHLEVVLSVLNERVRILQIATFRKRQKVEEKETERQQNVRGKIEAHVSKKVSRVFIKGLDSLNRIRGSRNTSNDNTNRPTSDAYGDLKIDRDDLNSEPSYCDKKGGLLYNGIAGQNYYKDVDSTDDMSNIERTHPDVFFGWEQKVEWKEDREISKEEYGHKYGNADTNRDVFPHEQKDGLESERKLILSSESDLEEAVTMQTAPIFDGMLSSTEKLTQTNQKQLQETHNLQPSQQSLILSEQKTKCKKESLFGKLKATFIDGLVTFTQESIATICSVARGLCRFIKNVAHQVLEGIRAIELLTVGAYYKTSSTGL